jgi:exonuclease SbcC
MIPEIEEITNKLLSAIDISCIVQLKVEKELKKGGMADTLDIYIWINGVRRPYVGYSGGERFIIDLSLRFALSVILLRRKGSSNSTLIIDEGMGTLDDEYRDKAMKLIQLIRSQYGFKKVIVISHIEEIQDQIENKIFLKKVNFETKVSYNIK